MDPLCAQRPFECLDVTEPEVADGWQCADSYHLPSIEHAPVPPEVDLKKLMSIRQAHAAEAADGKKLTVFIQKAQSPEDFKATPDTEPPDNDIHELFDHFVTGRTACHVIVSKIGQWMA